MKNDNDIIAAILTVAFYTGRGGAMGLPQIVSTFHEMRAILEEESKPGKKKK
ncbi:MAG: hypothetical protein HY046_11535 [Acidobacteria bacterium]|nr:hypothetical protein [Acidobacteriota bacterium]